MTERGRNLCCFLACAAAQLLAFVGGMLFDRTHFAARLDGDLKLYHAAAGAVLAGRVPYRDFALEYPPGALAALLIPGLVGGGETSRAAYAIAFAFQNAALSIACMLVAARVATRLHPGDARAARVTAILYTLLAVLGWAVIPYRFDLFPTLLTLVAVSSALARRHAAAGVFLGLGVLVKLYPLVLAPILLAHALRDHGRAATRFSAACAATMVICILPFLATSGTKTLAFLAYHKERGIQIESLAGGALCLGHVAGVTPVGVAYDHGALHLRSPTAERVLRFHEVVTPLALLASAAAWSYWLWRQRGDADRSLPVAAGGMLLAFILANKVFSPQFLIWLLPFVAILRGRGGRIFIVAWALTLLVYPFMYAALRDLSPMVVGLVNLRNLAVVTLLGAIIAEHVRRAGGRPHGDVGNWQPFTPAVRVPHFTGPNSQQREGL